MIKPDEEVYNHMLRSLATLESYDGADQGKAGPFLFNTPIIVTLNIITIIILTSLLFSPHLLKSIIRSGFFVAYFKDMQFSPLWNDSRPTQSQDKTNRMPINYNMNHIYYYEKSSWDFYRYGQFKDLTIPAVTMGFPITPVMKPWYWHPYLFLQVHWTWHSYRIQLGDDWSGTLWSRLIFLAILVGLIEWRSRRIERYFHDRASKVSSHSAVDGGLLGNNNNDRYSNHLLPLPALLYPLSVLGAGWASSIYGFFAVLTSSWIALQLVPGMMPPHLAIPLFGWTQIIFNFIVFLRLFHILYGCPPPPRRKIFFMAFCTFFVQVLHLLSIFLLSIHL